MGCYVALESARRIAEDGGAPGDVIAVAAVQEEVGDFAGSRTVAFSTEPDLAVAIDVTHTTDVRGADPEEEGKVVLGGGPTISRGPSIHEDVFELLYETAEAEGIPLVVEVSPDRHDVDRRRCHLPQPLRACRPGSSRCRSATCTRRSRCSTSTISSARCSSSWRSRAGSSPG